MQYEQNVAPPPLTFFDIETTGLEVVHAVTRGPRGLLSPWHEIIELGWVTIRQNNALRGEPWGVCDEANIQIASDPMRFRVADEEALEVNGYRERKARGEWTDAATLTEALWRFLESCAGSVLIGVNTCFDDKFFEIALLASGIPYAEMRNRFHYSILDVKSVALGRLLGTGVPYVPEYFRSGRLAELLGVTPEERPHRAVNGARQAYKIYRALMELDNRKMRALQKKLMRMHNNEHTRS